MSDIAIQIIETTEEMCDKFCKFSGTGDENGCVWCQTHENECPLDKIYEALGVKT